MEYEEMPFNYSNWDESNFVINELNVSKSEIGITGAVNPNDINVAALVVVLGCGLQYFDKDIFSFKGTKYFMFNREKATVTFIVQLVEKAIAEFEQEFEDRKSISAVRSQRFIKKTIEEAFDQIAQAVSSIHG